MSDTSSDDRLTDEQFEAIRARLDHTPAVPFTVAEPGVARVQMGDLRRIVHEAFSLLAEVERLRAREAEWRQLGGKVLAIDTDYETDEEGNDDELPYYISSRDLVDVQNQARALLGVETE